MTVFPAPPAVLAATSDGRLFPVRRLFCIGRNYAAHAREMGMDDREPPFFFTKWAQTIVPSGSTIAYAPETADLHHEAELVVAIDKPGRNIPESAALDHVFGYATGLDMTRRDLQFAARDKGRPWDVAKNFEAAAPLGLIHPASGPPPAGEISLTLNGDRRQHGRLEDMIWSVAEIIAFLSRFYRLEAGDLIFTGTPAGVGPVLVGDTLTVSITGLSDCVVTIGAPATD